MTSSRTNHDQNAGPAMEPLEVRSLMSNDFASVGLSFDTHFFGDTTPGVFATEGVLQDNGAAFGDTFFGAGTGRTRVGGLVFDSLDRFPDGRYRRHPNEGTLGGAFEANGAQFLTTDGFPAGWWFGDFGDGDKEAEFIVERPDQASISDFQGTWRFSLLGAHVPTDNFYSGNGRLVVHSGRIDWTAESGFVPGDGGSSNILTVTSDGRLFTDLDEYFYLSRDGSVMIFADMSTGDGHVFMGVAVRDTAAPPPQELVGDYLLEWGFTDANALGGPNDQVDYRQRYLRLEPDGDYRIWDLDRYDSGHTSNDDALSRGFWHTSGNALVLDRSNSADVLTLAISSNLSTLVGLDLDSGSGTDAILGLATRAFPHGVPGVAVPPILNTPASVPAGRPVVYQLGTDNIWEVVDLIAETGGPIITGDLVSWVDPKDGLGYAAGVSSSGLILYSQPSSGHWTFRNLTSEVFGGEAITGSLQAMTSPDGLVTLTGLSANGELLRYYQTGDTIGAGYRWFFGNINDQDLLPQGQSTPAFVGNLVGYATSWGGLNVAGLDSSGRIWSVWWAPGRARWSVADLTAASGALPLAGSLTVYLTPWNGINIAGLDGAGHIQVTWWVPSFGGAWAQNDLTAETGGPIFKPASVTSYVSSWGGLNIAGIEEGSSEVKVYWWAPARVNEGWAITSLDAAVPAGSELIYGDELHGIAGPDGSLNVFGYGLDGSFLRYFWEPSFGASWMSQNVTAIAVDR